MGKEVNIKIGEIIEFYSPKYGPFKVEIVGEIENFYKAILLPKADNYLRDKFYFLPKPAILTKS